MNEKLFVILKSCGIERDIHEDEFDKSFEEIGLDSLDTFSFLSEIQIVFNISFSERDYQEVRTLNDVIRLLHRNT